MRDAALGPGTGGVDSSAAAGVGPGVPAPAIAFHQPMSPDDALHVQAGTSCQFPALKTYFEGPSDLKAQVVRFVELGAQHHAGTTAVLYLGGYQREYSDLVFTRRGDDLGRVGVGTRAAAAAAARRRPEDTEHLPTTTLHEAPPGL